MRFVRLLTGASLVAALSLLSLPREASAIALGAALNTSGTNTFSLFIRIECSGLLCFAIGGSTPYAGQTQTSNLTGTSGLWADDLADTIQFSSDAGGTTGLMALTGTNMSFTGFNTTLTGGVSTVVVSNLAANAANAALASVAGFDLLTPPQSINFTNTLNIGATATTNAPNLSAIALPPTAVPAQGTFVNVGDPDLDLFPNFQIQNLRGAFQTLTSTATLGVTLRITLRATFTLNLIGESLTAIPEPASILFVGLGIAGFGVAAKRRTA